MRVRFTSSIIAIAFLSALNWVASSAPADDPAPPVKTVPVKVKPPPVGKPKDRVGAGARGPSQGLAEIFLLSPDKTGATARLQPTIYWFLTADTDVDIELVITPTDEDGAAASDKPVLKRTFSGNLRMGLHAVDLAAEKTSLTRGSRYRVSLLLHNSPDPSEDYRSIADLAVLDAPADVRDSHDVNTLAGAGLWYDAIDAAVKALNAKPGDATAQGQLAGMLWDQHSFCAYAHDRLSTLQSPAQKLQNEKESLRLEAFDKFLKITPVQK